MTFRPPYSNLNKVELEFNQFRDFNVELDDIRDQLNAIKNDFKNAEIIYNEDKQKLLDFKENQNIRALLNKLEPSHCPRCENILANEKKLDEKQDHICYICGNVHLEFNEEYEIFIQELENNLTASKKNYNELLIKVRELEKRENELNEIIKKQKKSIESIDIDEDKKNIDRRSDLLSEISKVQGKLEVRSQFSNANKQELICTDDSDKLKVLEEAEKESKKMIDNIKDDLFEDLNKEILKLVQSFGSDHIEWVKLNRNAQF